MYCVGSRRKRRFHWLFMIDLSLIYWGSLWTWGNRIFTLRRIWASPLLFVKRKFISNICKVLLFLWFTVVWQWIISWIFDSFIEDHTYKLFKKQMVGYFETQHSQLNKARWKCKIHTNSSTTNIWNRVGALFTFSVGLTSSVFTVLSSSLRHFFLVMPSIISSTNIP